MVFNSYDFLVFFPVVLFFYFLAPRKVRYIWLLVVSYYFYMCWNPKYAILIMISTLVTYGSGILIEYANNRWGGGKNCYKQWIVVISFSINIGILVFFKYSGFVIQNLNRILNQINVRDIDTFDIVLPVGISFYTFQALSYTVDVYRGEIRAEKNVLRYALFVSFFPQLVAGPIERSKNLLSQIDNVEQIKLWNLERVSSGFIIMLWGFFQKVVIADRLSIFVDQVYSEFWMYGMVELALATIFFAIQIYCDFGGYSLIAVGAARVMGFELMGNFNTPYFSMSVKEFWRRWHISLSTWFRDYLYIPLGGNRCSKKKKYRNLMITFLISGLWHGASWSFIIWGGLHGIYQIIGDMILPVKSKLLEKFRVNTECMSYRVGRIFLTFLLLCFAWIFFRMNSISNSFMFIKRMFTRPNWWVFYDQSLYTIGLDHMEMHVLFFSLVALFLVDLVRYKKGIAIDTYLREQNIWFRWAVLIMIFMAIIIYGIYGPSYDPAQFIYFQF